MSKIVYPEPKMMEAIADLAREIKEKEGGKWKIIYPRQTIATIVADGSDPITVCYSSFAEDDETHRRAVERQLEADLRAWGLRRDQVTVLYDEERQTKAAAE